MILMIDNYDSFSYNLYQAIGEINPDICVYRNDCLTTGDIKRLAPTHIILSPGPGRPSEAGICIDTVKEFKDKIPILGICLGHQAICEAFGAEIVYAKTPMHGKQSKILISSSCPIFKGLESEITAARYHSLAANEASIPDELLITAVSDGEVMAVMHKKYKIYGLQFHPESVLTPSGNIIINNFLMI